MKPRARSLPRACLLLLALLAFGGASAAAQTGQTTPPGQKGPPAPPPRVGGEWTELVSPEGRFSVLMVGAAKLKTQERDTPIGRIVLNSYMSITPAGGFGVSYTDYPRRPDSPEAVAAVLNGARDHVLASDKNMKLLSELELTIEGYPAREWLIANSANDQLFRARTFVAGARMYQLLLLTSVGPAFVKGQPGARPEDRDAEYEALSKKFFGSFKLLPEKPSAPAGAKNY